MYDDNNVFRVCSCVDLNWWAKGEKTGYYLTAKFLYKKDTPRK